MLSLLSSFIISVRIMFHPSQENIATRQEGTPHASWVDATLLPNVVITLWTVQMALMKQAVSILAKPGLHVHVFA